ncbi:MAG: serine/threonine protein kinase [Deltaproteobacteria bacterium]|nr:serine/threonine protein kinase [Deltaproteobacteria bacterium]
MTKPPDDTQFVPDEPRSTEVVADLPSFGRYRTQARIGSGAAGTVYRARDEVLGRDVAIKVLHTQTDPETRERFVREARAIASLPHEHVLSIYDVGTQHDASYLVVELARESLRDRLGAGPLSIDIARQIGIQISRALGTAHAAGIVHRDVKPANILAVFDGRWKLADFGIARLPDSTLTTIGQFLGSPSYAAPESLRAGVFVAASDVYALGSTLYEVIAGSPPFGHGDGAWKLKLSREPAPLPGVSRALSDLITAVLATDPARRPSAEQLAQVLATAH